MHLYNVQDWTLVSNNVKPGGNFVVLDLSPATWYNLKVRLAGWLAGWLVGWLVG